MGVDSELLHVPIGHGNAGCITGQIETGWLF